MHIYKLLIQRTLVYFDILHYIFLKTLSECLLDWLKLELFAQSLINLVKNQHDKIDEFLKNFQ